MPDLETRVQVEVGDTVLVRAQPALNGGADIAAAVVCRIRDDMKHPDGVPVVNVRVLLDCDVVQRRGPVPVFATRAEADLAVPVRTDTYAGWIRRSGPVV